MQLTVIAAILVAAAGVVFALQNLATVNVNLFWWSGESSLAVVLLLSVALGAVLIALISTPGTLRRQWLIARQKKRIDELERECAQLRSRASAPGAVPEALPASPPERPYVGLKQIVLGRGEDDTPR